jgi:hypothetical protein
MHHFFLANVLRYLLHIIYTYISYIHVIFSNYIQYFRLNPSTLLYMTIFDSVCCVLIILLLVILGEILARTLLITIRLLVSLNHIIIQNSVLLDHLRIIDVRLELLIELGRSIRDNLEAFNEFEFFYNNNNNTLLEIEHDINQ